MSGAVDGGPIVKGTRATAKQALGDLFKWKHRVIIENEYGEERQELRNPDKLRNPISLLRLLSAKDYLYFFVGFFAWTADAFDFHALSIQTYKLSPYYNVSKTEISTAITLTLLLRSVGAAVFGLLGDRFGRKWPMVANMIILGLLQIATIYSTTFQQFLAVRSLFGLFMGGVYGNAVAMALENCHTDARGLMSGIMQQGYSFGYVLAACANLGVGKSIESWKIVFWIAAGLSIAAGLLRCCFPESRQFREAKKTGEKITASDFWAETKLMLAKEWRMVIYCIILMTWFNFYSHTSQDSYTTFMVTQKELSSDAGTRASIWMKTGACVGGTIIGYLSQWLGRRRAICISALMSALLIPAWILPQGETPLAVTGFLIQFFVQGAWGVIPIHLNELSPPAYRSTFPGLTYQLGNMISSPSAQIVNAIAETHFVRSSSGALREAYGPVMGIATAIIAIGIIITAALGPEKRGRSFEHGPAGAAVHNRDGHHAEKGVDAASLAEDHKEEKAIEVEQAPTTAPAGTETKGTA
ncbi:major facilitator superfamily transporter [Microdochium bolleyi]|uniref:Major facilitator superfamily transporter n=1 Tax=Microdochium bolleyi TaxID=196109 RepID=A0A136IPM8_9PEZI|nr:major facilitator superfamily transporter [Microdochium bolleyi]